MWYFRSRVVYVNVIDVHIRSVHDIQGQKGRAIDEEMAQSDITNVPENHRHGVTWWCERFLGVVPCVPNPVNTPFTIAADTDIVTSDHEASLVVFVHYWIIVCTPVSQII